jgi:hypothetical protein
MVGSRNVDFLIIRMDQNYYSSTLHIDTETFRRDSDHVCELYSDETRLVSSKNRYLLICIDLWIFSETLLL